MTGTEILQRSVDAWNDGDREAYLDCYTEDCELTSPAGTAKGRAGVGEFWDEHMTAWPDRRVRVAALFASGDLVGEEAAVEGTNTGPFPGPGGVEVAATGRRFTGLFAAMHTVREGRIARSAFYWDPMAQAAQLGLLPG